MAEVYLATAHGPAAFTKVVALKRLLPHLAEHPKVVSMFLEEARIAAGLHHPHIVQIFDLVQAGADHFICMEYLPGRDLTAVIARCRKASISLPVEVVAHLGSCIAQGLEFAHRQTGAEGGFGPIVHGDISPSNVVVTFVGEVKIIDFGIARVATGAELSFPGTIQGKPAYLSPEQIAEGRSDARSDIFALGVVLYELLTGERLFRRETRETTLRAILEAPIPDPRKLRPDLPEGLVNLVMKALERDPNRRFQEACALQMGLESLLVERAWLPTSARLAAFLENLFGQSFVGIALGLASSEPTGTATASGGPTLRPKMDLGTDAVPLVAERNVRRERGRQLVRVVADVPAALLRAGQELVAVPANLVRFARRWTRRRLIVAAAAVAAIGFTAGIALREIRDAALGSAPLALEAPSTSEAPGKPGAVAIPESPSASTTRGPMPKAGFEGIDSHGRKKGRAARTVDAKKGRLHPTGG